MSKARVCRCGNIIDCECSTVRTKGKLPEWSKASVKQLKQNIRERDRAEKALKTATSNLKKFLNKDVDAFDKKAKAAGCEVDTTGWPYRRDGKFVYRVTTCCFAVAEIDQDSGAIVCKGCFHEVSYVALDAPRVSVGTRR